MIRRLAVAIAALPLMALSCPDETRWAIESEIMRSVEATRTEDIDAFMKGVPPDYYAQSADGVLIDAAQLRDDVLREWERVERTNAIETSIERMERNPDRSITVWTASRWDRNIVAVDGAARHRVVTESRHREVWRRRGAQWFQYGSEVLERRTWIDGALQS